MCFNKLREYMVQKQKILPWVVNHKMFKWNTRLNVDPKRSVTYDSVEIAAPILNSAHQQA